jgi:hypothetical protein
MNDTPASSPGPAYAVPLPKSAIDLAKAINAQIGQQQAQNRDAVLALLMLVANQHAAQGRAPHQAGHLHRMLDALLVSAWDTMQAMQAKATH